MNGKYANKKNNGAGRKLLILLAMVLCLAAALWFVMAGPGRASDPRPDGSDAASDFTENTGGTSAGSGEEAEGRSSFTLERGLEITRYGKYIGAYVEDGSDEIVDNVMMIQVCNSGEQPIQYAKLILTGSAGEAVFELSTLMPGDSVIVLEANRKSFGEEDSYSEARAENVAYFQNEICLYEDILQIQPLEGGFNITNISDEDITGDIYIYYKHVSDGLYWGGITYRGRIEGGMKAGEIRQIISSHFTADDSQIMFITIAEK